MTWGPLFMYYHCPSCGQKFKYELDLLASLGKRFGCCPECSCEGVYEKEGPVMSDDKEYAEAD